MARTMPVSLHGYVRICMYVYYKMWTEGDKSSGVDNEDGYAEPNPSATFPSQIPVQRLCRLYVYL